MAYRAEIEIGVKGAKQLRDLRSTVEDLAEKIRYLDDISNVFNAPIQSIENFNRTLKTAAENLRLVETASSDEITAIRTYVTALGEATAAQTRQNTLIQNEIALREEAARVAKLHADGIKEVTQYAGPIGPGAASPIDAPVREGRRGVEGTVASPIDPSRGVAIKKDELALEQALLALQERKADAVFEQLRNSEALVQSANEAKLIALEAQGARPQSELVSMSPQRRLKIESRERTQQLAQEAIDRGKAAQEEFELRRQNISKISEFTKQNEAVVFGIRAKAIRRQLDLEFNRIMQTAKEENKANENIFKKFMQQDKEYYDDWRKRLNERTAARKKADKEVDNNRRKLDQQAEQRRRKRRDIAGSAIIGGAFPLLFGQGVGAAAGGGLGGALGGMAGGQMGFALSLLGTQVGTFADQIVGGAATLGQALDPLRGNLNEVAKAAGFANTEIETSLNVIKQLGSEQQALKLATELLASTIGNEGVTALQEFGNDTQVLANAFSRAMSLMQVAAARLFGGLTKLAGQALQDAVDLEAGLQDRQDPELQKLQKQRAQLRTGASGESDAFVGEDINARLAAIAKIDDQIRQIQRDRREQIEKAIIAEGVSLQNAKLLQQFNVKDTQLQKIKTGLAGLETDYLNNNFVALKRQEIQREKELKIEEARKAVGEDINGNIKNQNLLSKITSSITQEALSKEAKLNQQIDAASQRAADRASAAATRQAAKNQRLEKQRLAQERRAGKVTTDLQNQLDLLEVMGSAEARKLQIELQYERTLARINELKNQEQAEAQTLLAQQIKQKQEANLEFELSKKRADAIRSAVAPIRNIREQQEASVAANKEYNRLLMEGVLPAEAKRITEFNKQVEAQLRQKDELIEVTQLDILRAEANGATTEKLQEQLDLLKSQRKAIEGEAAKGPGASGQSDRQTIEDRVAQLKGEITELTNLGNISVRVADNIGAAFGTAFQDVINGSKSTQEALSDMFKTIGQSFVQMAAEIIVKQLTMIALQALLKALGGPSFGGSGGGGGFDSAPLGSGFSTGATPSGFDAVGAGIFGGRANGGPVQSGQPYMVGERGPELFVPSTNGGVMRNEDMRQLMGRSPASNAPAMNFTFETTNIGGQEFVSREQLEAAMATTRRQAAADGASRGMNMTLDKMQNSPRTRSRIGIG